jgi:hypothetical protein
MDKTSGSIVTKIAEFGDSSGLGIGELGDTAEVSDFSELLLIVELKSLNASSKLFSFT